MGKRGGGRWSLWALRSPVTQLLNSPRTHTHLQVLLHFCLGAFALASETFFPLPLLGWMALWSAQSAPPQGDIHSCPQPPPL